MNMKKASMTSKFRRFETKFDRKAVTEDRIALREKRERSMMESLNTESDDDYDFQDLWEQDQYEDDDS